MELFLLRLRLFSIVLGVFVLKEEKFFHKMTGN